ncbi:MAG: thioredoxin family protein [Spirosomataceae bacterium]
MKAILLFCFVVVSSGQWGTDFKHAKDEAHQAHKLILLNFSGSDWCGPCIKLKRDILDNEEFLQFAQNKLVLVRADFPRNKKNQLSPEITSHNEALAEIYNKEGKFPYTVLLNADGEVLKEWDGFPKSLSITSLMEDIESASPKVR